MPYQLFLIASLLIPQVPSLFASNAYFLAQVQLFACSTLQMMLIHLIVFQGHAGTHFQGNSRPIAGTTCIRSATLSQNGRTLKSSGPKRPW